jgi:LacI family transcriptional regulator
MNLETIAQMSGVSRSTVSRVINNSPNVRPEVRERVLAVLRETNFHPNVAARSLASGATRILGLVIPLEVRQLFMDPYFPLLIQGVMGACNTHDYSVMLWLAEPEYERRMIQQILHSGLINGVIVSSIQSDDPLIDALIERSFPFVVVGRSPEGKHVPYVDVDNVSSARRAVEHLIGLGRRRIATITGVPGTTVGADRLDGYRLGLRGAKLAEQPGLIAEGDFTQEGGYRAMKALLQAHPDAVFAASDSMAQGAVRAIQEAGLNIPQDVAVVGFDDVPFAAHMQPPLTTVRQPIEQLGRAAVDLLAEMLNQGLEQPQHRLLTTELIIRSSCGSE